MPATMKYEDFKSVFIDKEKPVTIWKLERDSDKIEARNLKDAIGEKHYAAIRDIVSMCPDETAKKLWNACEKFIRVAEKPSEPGKACFDFGDKCIHINIDYISKGSDISNKYQTVFHESAHFFDWLLSRLDKQFSFEYKNMTFTKAIRKDVDAYIETTKEDVKKLFSYAISTNDRNSLNKLFDGLYTFEEVDSTGRYLRVDNDGISSAGMLKYLKWDDKWDDHIVTKFVVDKITKSGDSTMWANVSDIFEGATKGKIRCGTGHITDEDPNYWGNGMHLPAEAFAEFFDSTMANLKSLEFMKRCFPTAYGIFQEMLKEMLKEVTLA